MFRSIFAVIVIIAGLKISESYLRNGQINREQLEIGTKYYRKFPKTSTGENSDTCPLKTGYNDQSECGRGTPCDGGNTTKLWWKPKIIDPRSLLEVYFEFVLPFSVENITATLQVYLFHEKYPIFTFIQNATCKDLIAKLEEYGYIIPCPLPVGLSIPIRYPFRSLSKLPMGNFTIVANVTNESSQELFCVKAEFEIRRNKLI